jgi:putative transposase
MKPISNAHHKFPAEMIRHAVWQYLRFTLSYSDVKELLAERRNTQEPVSRFSPGA